MAKFVTKEGLEKLKKELENLKTTKQKQIAERLRKAIAFGDLSENFEYSDAKEEQAMLQAKVADLEKQIREAKVVEKTAGSDRVQIGSTVTLKGAGLQTLQVVTASEADPLKGKVSAESPLGSSLLGKKVGDTAQCETPGGKMKCKILSIE